MNNPEAIRFVNEVIRPKSETIRALEAECKSAKASWVLTLQQEFSKDPAELVEDGRDAEGVSRLTCGDVSEVIEAFDIILSVAAKMTAIQKACVRALRAE